MSIFIRIAFLITFFFALSGKALAIPVLDPEDMEILIDPEDYELEEEPYNPQYLWKRSGFWSSHPSDFNPMRRPTSGGQQQPRNANAKKSENNPYHPLPRSVNQNQKNQRSAPSNDELEAMYEGLRDKRQSPGSFLLMKLGRSNKSQNRNDVNRRLGRRRV